MRSRSTRLKSVRANGLPLVPLKPAGKPPWDEARLFAAYIATATALIFCTQVHSWAPGPAVWSFFYFVLRFLFVRARPRLTGKFSLSHARKIVGRLADPPSAGAAPFRQNSRRL